MMFLYPLRSSPLLLTLFASFMIWVASVNIILLILGVFGFAVSVTAFSKYLFFILERTANGYNDPPVLSYEIVRPFEEFRSYQLILILACAFALTAWLWKHGLDYLAVILVIFFLGTLPALIGLLGIHNGFFASLNPVVLLRFIQRIGIVYLAMLGVLAASIALIVVFYQSGPGLFAAIFITLYSLILVFHWLGKIIYAKREALDYRPSNSPEREAEKAAAELLQKRKHILERIFKERRRENVLAVLLAHIETEQDKLAAHAWYHREMMQWDNKRLAVNHAQFYVRALREAGKHIIADLIQQECRVIDPDFSVE